MLVVDALTVTFGAVRAVDGVSLRLDPGGVLAVLGPSGCGKSTLLRAVAGLEHVDEGSVRFGGVDLTRTPAHRRGFALMFQDGQLFSHLSVAGNVGYPLRLRRTPRAERAARVGELLELVGLSGYADRRPATLSGGERQRVALARALAVRPRLLLLDEPLSALDRGLRERLAAELHDILRAAGTTAVLVTHDHDEAFAVADRMAVMRAGRIVQSGTLAEVWRHPADAETARFLGYAAVVSGAAAARLLGGPHPGGSVGAVALRRSALQVVAEGRVDDTDATPRLVGVVRSARLTPEQWRAVVELPGIGALDAVAEPDVPLRAGEQVLLRIDPNRIALLPAGAAQESGTLPGEAGTTASAPQPDRA